MTRRVAVEDLTRDQLERALLVLSGRFNALVKTVREHTEDHWKVRKEVEDLVGKAGERLLFVHRVAADTRADRVRAILNEAYWHELAAATEPGHLPHSTDRGTALG